MTESELLEKFYSSKFYLSYSGLNKLMYSPSTFYRHYILQEREEKLDASLIQGKLVHCILLDDGSFHEQFIVSPDSLPSDNTKMVVDIIFSKHQKGEQRLLFSYKDQILEILKNVNLHQSLKTDQQRVEKVVNESSNSYWEFLVAAEGRTVVDSKTLSEANQMAEVVRSNTKISDLMGMLTTEMDDVEVLNEEYMQTENGRVFGLKGILDNVKIDKTAKTIYINDLKTSGKALADFPESVEFYNYWAQAAIYYRLVVQKFSGIITPEWKIIFTFIVIDKFNQVYPMQVTEQTMKDWQLKLDKKLEEAEWHYKNKDYTLPYQFATGGVVL